MSLQESPRSFGIILGAMKCGTTAVFAALESMPEVCASRPKEPEFFAREALFQLGPDAYLRLYDWKPGQHRIAIEACTDHTKAPAVTGNAARMLQTGWQFRFVYLVRDPVDRIVSHYTMALALGWEIRDLDAGVDHHALDICRYARQLEPYVKCFGRESILVVRMEDLIADPDGQMCRILTHFGLNGLPLPKFDRVHETSHHYGKALKVRLAAINSRIASAGHSPLSLEQLTRPSPSLKEAILRELASDMILLRDEFGVDISPWYAGHRELIA